MAFIEHQHGEVAEELFTGSFASIKLVPSDEWDLVVYTEVRVELLHYFRHKRKNGIRC